MSSSPPAEISGVPRNIMCSSACASPVLPGVSSSEPKPYQTEVWTTGAARSSTTTTLSPFRSVVV